MALTKAPTYGKNSFYAPVVKKPAVVAPKKAPLPAGMAPINTGMSDSDREKYLEGGGAWGVGNYTPATVQALDTGWASTPNYTTDQSGTVVLKPGGGGAQRPSYSDYFNKMLPGDWEVLAAEGAFGTEMGRLRNLLTGNIRESLIGLGLPENEKVKGEFGSYIDTDTITKAIGNKYSTAAQIATQERRAKANASAALAARGSLHSGALTNRKSRILEEAEGGRYRAVQEFLTGARGGLGQLGEAETRLRGDIASARGRAGARLATQYGYDYPEVTTAADVLPLAPVSPVAPVTPASPVAPVTQPPAANQKPRVETPAERALRLRSEALNKRYGIG